MSDSVVCPHCRKEFEVGQRMYLFKPKRGRITHGVVTRHRGSGVFEADRVFAGGFHIFCTGKLGEGEGTISEVSMSTGWVTCKKCVAKMKAEGIPVAPPTNDEQWPPEHLRPLGRPRFLGIPG